MAPSDVAVRPRRSAFAAAFLTLIFPGLGHAYLRRWLRALAWAALPLLGLVGILGLGFSGGFTDLATQLFDPDVLTGVIVFIGIDFLYRLLAMLDAWRLAADTTVGNAGSRTLSLAGLGALVVVLLASHVAVARPVMFASDTLNDITSNAGDDTEVLTADELVAEGGDDFELLTEDLVQQATPDASAQPGTTDPIATAEPTEVPTEVPTEAPTAPATEAPTSEPEASLPEWNGKERLNILLIGSDGGRQGRASASLLTDTMITISVDPTTGRVAFISLPRDAAGIPLPRNWGAYSALGGKWNNKINTLYAQARARPGWFPGNDKERGYRALMGTLGNLYALDIKYYVAVDLNSFRSVVNALGGVVVDVQLPVQDYGYPTDDGRGKLKLYVQPGMRKMNGQQSLAYARSRHQSDDFARSARQQRVITSVRDQTHINDLLEDPSIITKLIKQMRKDVKTNIPPKLVPKMLALAQKIDLDRRENLVLSSGRYVEECYPCGSSGLWVLKAKPSAIKGAVKNIFTTSKAKARQINKIRGEGATVHILNGQGGGNTKAIKLADKLANDGVDAVVPPLNGGRADGNDYTNTVITFYNGAQEAMPETATRIKRTFKDKKREVRNVEDLEAVADVVVVVGSKTDPA